MSSLSRVMLSEVRCFLAETYKRGYSVAQMLYEPNLYYVIVNIDCCYNFCNLDACTNILNIRHFVLFLKVHNIAYV